jgi:hypothetical protein
MTDLSFQITGVEPITHGLIPLLQFKLRITNTPATQTIQAVMLHAQVQIQSAQRAYTPAEKDRLVEIFGAPDQWGQTLRNRLWTHINVTVPTFTGRTDMSVPVPCTYDLNVIGGKYFYALEGDEVPLLFLFSGSVFYKTTDERLQIERVSWEKECTYRMPVRVWQELMEYHYPNSVWLYLQRDMFDRLYAYKREHGLATWEQTIEHLLPAEVNA